MKKTILVFLTLLCCVQLSFASITVKGRVFDNSTGHPMEYATVRACTLPDTTFVSGCITEPTGAFSMELEKGRYVLEVQYMGFVTKYKNVTLDGSKSTVDVGKISLSPDSRMLNEVDVVAEQSTYEMTLDKRVFNVGKDVANTAGNAIEVLENIPAVSVDVEGNVSLRGDDGVRILIDGKESGLSGMSTQDALRTLQGDMIERVEVITNPSVRYDAEGSAGIINIILKKDKRQGFNGAVNVRMGYPWMYGASLSANYRLKRWNLFASYGFNNRRNIGGGVNQTKRFDIIDGDTIFNQLTDQTTERKMRRMGHNVRLGADYYITDHDIVSAALVYRYGRLETHPVVNYIDEYPLTGVSSYDVRAEDYEEYEPMYEVTLDYDKTFERKGRSLKANIRYFTNAENSSSDITETLYPDKNMEQALWTLYQKTSNDQGMRNLQASIDYVHPFLTKAQWEIGAKYTNRNINSLSTVTEQDSTGQFHPLSDYCYDYEYSEQVAAFYTSLGNDWGRWSGQVGLRAEMTDIMTNLKGYANDGNDSINGGKPYFDFFPSAHLNYSVNENNQFQVSYTRRIRRPGFWQMSPFRSYNDNRNIRMGNPNLTPTYMDSYELGYIHFWDKASFNFTAYYRHGTNMIRHYTYEDDGVFYSKPINFGKADDFGVEAVAQGQMTKWWNLNGNVNFFRSKFNGEINGKLYDDATWMLFGRAVSKFKVSNWFDLQLTAHVMGPHKEPLGMHKGNWWMDLAVSKEILHGSGTLTFNVRDLFNSRSHGGESWGDNFWQYSTSTWNRRSFSLNFNYRINQQNMKRNRPDGEGGDEGGGGGEEQQSEDMY
ncbi:MAG: TonB-dependent receptor family protein [Bacteroidales bacterium]|nr:TonB-dependent receptor family protein [Bacteroidales bacterium]